MNANQLPVVPTDKPPLKPHSKPWYRQGEFWRGFGLFYAVTIVTGLLWIGLSSLNNALHIEGLLHNIFATVAIIVAFLPFPILLGMIIYFFIRKPLIAWGLLVGFALALFVAPLILGAWLLYFCFTFSG